ncbi:MAG: FAD-binding oxidoreductase [Peptococcaceae bacterium]
MFDKQLKVPADLKDLQDTIKKARAEGSKVVLKENIVLNKVSRDEQAVIIDLENFSEISELDKENFTVKVQGGINFLHFQTRLADLGFYFPMDTYASRQTSLTYNVLHGLLSYSLGAYGNYREYVLGMEAVLFNGEIIKLGGKNIKNVSGLDIMGLLVASKETLGIMTSLTLRLLPLPEEKRVLIIDFPGADSALQALAEIREKGINPAKLLFVRSQDHRLFPELNLPGTGIQVIVEIEGFKEAVPRRVTLLKEIALDKYQGTVKAEVAAPDGIRKLWQGVREFQYSAVIQEGQEILYSSSFSKLAALALELEDLLAGHKHLMLQINGNTGTGTIILPKAAGSGVKKDIYKAVETAGGKIFNKNRAVKGLDSIGNKLRKAFDPSGISFWAGEER